MKKGGKYFEKVLWGSILAAVLLTGCGSGQKNASMDYAASMADMKEEAAEEAAEYETAVSEEMDYDSGVLETPGAVPASGTEEDPGAAVSAGRKLIRNVYMNVETMEFDSFIQQLSGQVSACGGYVENSSVSGNSYYYNGRRYASMTARIPADKLDGFVLGVSGLGNVTDKSESVEDITLRYVDVESRKKALEVEQDRLLSLLEKAESVEDIITIETRLSEVRYELESYGSQLRTYDNQVNYSTVQMDIREVERETPTQEKTAWDRMKNGFAESIFDIVQGMKDFFIGVVINLPYILIWALILFLLYKIGKIIYHKIRKKNAVGVPGNPEGGKPLKRRKLLGHRKEDPGDGPEEESKD